MKRCKPWLFIFLIGVVAHWLSPLPVSAQPTEVDLKKEAEEARRAREEFLREQRVLFRRGELQLEFSTFYSMDTRLAIIRTESSAVLAKITSRSVLPTLIVRYGLVDNLEFNLGIPFFGYAEQKIDFGTVVSKTADQGVGDITGTVKYQLWREQGARPDVILDLGVKSRTGGDTLLGTGHWNILGGITLVKTLDPVVFFGRLGYAYTLEREGVDLGNEISFLLGTGFSLNDRVSFSMRVDGTYVGPAERDGRNIIDTRLEIVSLRLSVTVQVTRRTFVEPSVSFGLTDDADDVMLGINVPFNLPFQF